MTDNTSHLFFQIRNKSLNGWRRNDGEEVVVDMKVFHDVKNILFRSVGTQTEVIDD
jgi:hypothetical protein